MIAWFTRYFFFHVIFLLQVRNQRRCSTTESPYHLPPPKQSRQFSIGRLSTTSCATSSPVSCWGNTASSRSTVLHTIVHLVLVPGIDWDLWNQKWGLIHRKWHRSNQVKLPLRPQSSGTLPWIFQCSFIFCVFFFVCLQLQAPLVMLASECMRNQCQIEYLPQPNLPVDFANFTTASGLARATRRRSQTAAVSLCVIQKRVKTCGELTAAQCCSDLCETGSHRDQVSL